MKKVLAILFWLISVAAYSQVVHSEIEQSAIDFLATHILPTEDNVKSFRYDGRITKGDRSLASAVSAMWMLPFCKQNEYRDRKEAGLSVSEVNWHKKGVELDKQLKSQPFDTTFHFSEVKLRVPKGLKQVKAYKRSKQRKGYYTYLWNRWKPSLFGSVHNVFLFDAIEFEDLYLVTIHANGLHNTSGKLYYIVLDKEGKVTDWCKTTWIS